MAKQPTTGEAMAALKRRADMSFDQIATAAGYAGKSSVQKYFEPHYNLPLSPKAARKFMNAFVGKGSPTISGKDLLTLVGLNEGFEDEIKVPSEQLNNIGALPRDVPIFGTALGGSHEYGSEDGTKKVAIEQATLDQSEVIGFLRRPQVLDGRKDVYAVYIAGSSMYPRFGDGEAVFVDPKRPPMIGDDVILQLSVGDESDVAGNDRVTVVLIKRLLRRSASFVELEQFNPPRTFRVDSAAVKKIHRIIPPGELFG